MQLKNTYEHFVFVNSPTLNFISNIDWSLYLWWAQGHKLKQNVHYNLIFWNNFGYFGKTFSNIHWYVWRWPDTKLCFGQQIYCSNQLLYVKWYMKNVTYKYNWPNGSIYKHFYLDLSFVIDWLTLHKNKYFFIPINNISKSNSEVTLKLIVK